MSEKIDFSGSVAATRMDLHKSGNAIWIDFRTTDGRVVRLDMHQSAIGAIVGELLDASQKLAVMRGDGHIAGKNFIVVDGFETGELPDKQDLMLVLRSGSLDYRFMVPKGLKDSSGETLIDGLIEALQSLRDRPHSGH